MTSLAEDIVQITTDLFNDRSDLEAHLQEIAERILPRHRALFETGGRSWEREGSKRNEQMVDASGAIALERFSSVMESMLTPGHSIWHGLKNSNHDLNKIMRVRLYYEKLNEALWFERKKPQANHQSQQFERYMSLGAYGTGPLWIDGMANGGLRYRAIHLAEVCFSANHQGIIDSAYRRFDETARQVMQKSEDGIYQHVPEKIQKAASDPKTMNKKFKIVHCVRPQIEDRSRRDFRSMPFASAYVSMDDKEIMSQGGFQTFPYSISRYVTTPGELYGRSPAMTALPSIKSLNRMKLAHLKQGHRALDPALLIHDDSMMDGISLQNGALNFGGVTKDGRPLVHTIPTGQLSAGEEMMDREKQVINDVFLVTIFQILVERRGQTPPTATEVLELAKEKGSLLSPTMGRQESEALSPQIARELDILSQQGRLPPLPPELVEAEGEYEIVYDNPLARAVRAEEASGLFRSIEFATAHANVTQDPSAFDWINIDKAMPAVMDINAVPASWQNDMNRVKAIRESRDQEKRTQQMIEAAPAAAGVLKAVQ